MFPRAASCGGPEATSNGHRSRWTVWDEIVRHLPSFESAVLTGLDAEGYPYSVRCRPRIDPTARTLKVQLPAAIRPGPASLLCHLDSGRSGLELPSPEVRGGGRDWGSDGPGTLRHRLAEERQTLPGEAWATPSAHTLGGGQRDQSAGSGGRAPDQVDRGAPRQGNIPTYHSASFQISGCSSPSSPISAKISTARLRCAIDSS